MRGGGEGGEEQRLLFLECFFVVAPSSERSVLGERNRSRKKGGVCAYVREFMLLLLMVPWLLLLLFCALWRFVTVEGSIR